MTQEEIYKILAEKVGPDGLILQGEAGDPFIKVDPAKLFAAAQTLRDDPRLGFNHLQIVSGVDTGMELWVVYHLYSLTNKHATVLKVILPRENAQVKSISSLWPAADWHERETYDMYGIKFTDHPNLKRILMMSKWQGHPLRKDYQMPDDSQYQVNDEDDPWEEY